MIFYLLAKIIKVDGDYSVADRISFRTILPLLLV